MRRALPAIAVLLAACRGGGGSPTCGIAALAAPTLIHEQLLNARAIITDPPRGLPPELPARVVGQEPAKLLVGYDAQTKLVMGYQGVGFPPRGWALLVVDDSSQRAHGVLIYESAEPRDYPKLGVVSAGTLLENLYGVRVDWASVSNPRCPLFGSSAPPKSSS